MQLQSVLVLIIKDFNCCIIYFLYFLSSQSPEETESVQQDRGAAAKKAHCSVTEDISVSKIKSSVSKESHADGGDSEDLSAESTLAPGEGSKSAQKSEGILSQCEDEVDDTYPTPRLPYPCLSGLSFKEHRMYLDILKNKKPVAPPQVHF